ncbi:DMT family transporter [Roseateles sp. PN1]|uniref:DMT family transporter n=2 Tax=Roseateles TaxID=93681 RepID=UPI00313A3F73
MTQTMAWVYLLLAGVCEIGWPLGFKLSQQAEYRVSGIVAAVASMGLSGWLLWMAQREIPIGTAYAVWTGIGGAGTFLIGVMFFGDAATLWRFLGVAMIVGGVITLKLAH